MFTEEKDFEIKFKLENRLLNGGINHISKFGPYIFHIILGNNKNRLLMIQLEHLFGDEIY